MSKSFLIIPASISTLVYPIIAEYNSKNLDESIKNIVDKTLRYTLITLSILGILIIFLSNILILFFYGPEFLPAIVPLGILIIGMIFFGSMSAIGMVFTAIGRADIPIKVSLISAIVNLILNITLIPIYGIIGAAISTSTSFVIITILDLYILNRTLNVNLKIKWQIKVLSFNSLVIITFFILKNYLSIYSLSIIFVVYLMIVSKFLLNSEDRKYIKSLFRIFINKSN